MNRAREARRAEIHVGPNEVLRFLRELAALASMALAVAFAALVAAHYAVGYRRILWLLRDGAGE